MPEPVRVETQKILRDYTNYRVEIFNEKTLSREKISEILRNSEVYLNRLWKQAQIMGKNEPSQEVVSLFVDGINEVINLQNSRWAAFNARVPLLIYETLFLIALLSMWLTGFYFQERRRRTWLLVGMLSLMISSVIYLIMDLDQAERGSIRTNTVAMQSLQELVNQTTGYIP